MGMDPPRTCRTVGADDLLRANMSIKEVTVSLDAGKTGRGRCRKASFSGRTDLPKGYIILSAGFKYFLFSPLFGEDWVETTN